MVKAISSTPVSGDWIIDWLQKPRQPGVVILHWVVLWLIYGVLFGLLFQIFDRAAAIANLLPLTFYTFTYGRRGGLLITLIVIPLSLLGYVLLGGMVQLDLLTNKFWVSNVGLLLFAYLLGWAVELRQRVREELSHSRHLQQQLAGERNRALAVSQTKDNLLATISHDLRTPIGGIIQSAQLLQQPLPADMRMRVSRHIQSSGHQLLDVVNDLLDLYRQDAQTAAETAEPFDPGGQITEIARLMQPMFEARKLTLTPVIEAGVPARVSGYPKLLRQTLFNLLGNSLKYTERGGVTLTVATDSAGKLLIRVSDSGTGIDEALIPAILDRSYRYSRTMTEDDKTGYGLGLSNCLKMVETMNGELSIASPPGGGTTVTLTLPLIIARTGAADRYQPSDRDFVTVTPIAAGKRVLLIEDNETNIVTLTAMLELLGCETRVARDGARAMQFAGEAFDLILVDRQLPDRSGEEVIAALHAGRQPLQCRPLIVLLTADVLALADGEWLTPDIDLVLTKPISFDELRRLLQQPVITEIQPAGAATGPLLDTVHLHEESRLLGAATLEHLLEMYLQEAPDYFRRCLLEFGKQDYRRCAAYAHKLGGAARSVGLPQLAQCASEVEQRCLQKDRIRLYTCLTRLHDAGRRSLRAVQEYLDNSRPSL